MLVALVRVAHLIVLGPAGLAGRRVANVNVLIVSNQGAVLQGERRFVGNGDFHVLGGIRSGFAPRCRRQAQG